MSHQLEANRGVFRTAAWHGLGTVPTETITNLADFLREGGMFYDVEKRPAFQELDGMNDNGEAVKIYRPVENQFHLVRSDDGKIVSDKTVSAQYDPMDPKKTCDIIQAFCEQGFATPDGAFSLYNGNSEVISLALDYQDPIESGSVWKHFLVVQNSHGSGKFRGKLTSIRVVCDNAVTAAFARGADFAIAHKGQTFDRVKYAVETWSRVRDYLRTMGQKYGKLLVCPVDINACVDDILEIKAGEKISTQLENKRDELIRLANGGSPGTAGKTAADVFNAVTYWASYNTGGKGSKDERERFASNLDGTRAKFTQAALDKLLVLAGADD